MELTVLNIHKDEVPGEKKSMRLGVKKQLKITLIIFLILAAAVMSYLLYYVINHQKYVDKSYPIYNYSSNAKVDYDVFLIPNIVYNKRSMGEGMVYFSNLIDYINTVLKYEFHGEAKGDISGSYNVSALLQGYVQNDDSIKVIWTKDLSIQNSKKFSGNDKNLSITNKIPMKLKTYSDMAALIEKTLNCSASSRLIVSWNITINYKTDKGNVSESLSPSLMIPITTSWFEISGDQNQNKNGSINGTHKVVSPTYLKKVIALSAGIGICIILEVFMLFFTKSKLNPSEHRKKLNRIFKEYGSRMTLFSGKLPSSKEVIEVCTMDDLARISDDIGRSIFYEGSIDPEELVDFFVIDERNIYKFHMKKELPPETMHEDEQLKTVNE